ncbi:cyclin [Anaeramoeba ignava]|uniref:Cyclin n=1 Tax=Anaeramoeba ignava TaxID=1746090 RepID=A0A9Q0LET4_ANAIG|nr:cyclin [Anaeramoeba ignava]
MIKFPKLFTTFSFNNPINSNKIENYLNISTNQFDYQKKTNINESSLISKQNKGKFRSNYNQKKNLKGIELIKEKRMKKKTSLEKGNSKRINLRDDYLAIDKEMDIDNQLIQNDLNENDLIQSDLIQNDLIQNQLIQNDLIQNDLIQSDLIQNDLIQSDLIQNDLIQNDLIQNDLIQNDLIQNDLIQNDLNENDLIQNDLIQNDLIQNDLIQNDLIQNDLIQNDFNIQKKPFKSNIDKHVSLPTFDHIPNNFGSYPFNINQKIHQKIKKKLEILFEKFLNQTKEESKKSFTNFCTFQINSNQIDPNKREHLKSRFNSLSQINFANRCLTDNHLEMMLEKEKSFQKEKIQNSKIHNQNYRNKMIDSISFSCHELDLTKETFYLSIEYFERLINLIPNKISHQEKLYQNACILLAAKMNEEEVPSISLFAPFFEFDQNYDQKLIEAEKEILKIFNYKLTDPTINSFLIYFLDRARWCFPIESFPSLAKGSIDYDLVHEYSSIISHIPKKHDQLQNPKDIQFVERFFKIPKFPKDLYWIICEIINLALRDVKSLQFQPSLIAAAAFSCYFRDPKLVELITTFSQENLFQCKNWISKYDRSQRRAFKINDEFLDLIKEDEVFFHFHNVSANEFIRRFLD